MDCVCQPSSRVGARSEKGVHRVFACERAVRTERLRSWPHQAHLTTLPYAPGTVRRSKPCRTVVSSGRLEMLFSKGQIRLRINHVQDVLLSSDTDDACKTSSGFRAGTRCLQKYEHQCS
jgi:hypothetical protein